MDRDSDNFDESVDRVIVWGRQSFPKVIGRAKELKIPLLFMEDGFIRSVSLGLDFAQNYSMVLDSRGIYFDTTAPNDLEDILNSYNFSSDLLKDGRSKAYREPIA